MKVEVTSRAYGTYRFPQLEDGQLAELVAPDGSRRVVQRHGERLIVVGAPETSSWGRAAAEHLHLEPLAPGSTFVLRS